MRKIIVISMISLDGVLQGPGGRKEDTSGGFKHSGWSASYGDAGLDRSIQRELSRPVDYLLGRKTFKIWEPYWPKHADFWPGINEGMKYVLSKTVKRSDWARTAFLKGVADIKKLKRSKGRDLQVWGSSGLIQLLLEHDLVDELHLKTYPLTLGKGKKLFGKGAIPAAFKLTRSAVTPKGVVLADYVRAGKIKMGNIEV